MALNIRQKQADALLRMLNLHAPASAGKGEGELYKVLVLDRFCKDVIAPLLRVAELRAQGVTLHLLLEQERQPISDVPAVYFVQPTPANVERIVADAGAALYDVMHVNFATSVPGRLLESLAAGAVRAGATGRIAKLFDEYSAFIALEPTLFSLGLPHAHVALNDPAAKDSHIEAEVSAIVDGLFSVLVTLGVVPIIRCPRGGAAEHVAAALDSRLRDHLKARSNLFSEGASALSATLSRPLLVIFDRTFDLSVMLQHAWSYKPLVQDVLGLRLNRVSLAPDTAGLPPGAGLLPGHQKKSYDVDDKDFFWEAAGALPFPKVAEEVESQLQKYKAAVDEINAKTAGHDADGVQPDHEELLRRNTQNLMSAVSSLPELQEKKKVLDKHTNLATSLLGAIKGRGLDGFYNTEEDLLTGKADSAALLKLLQGAKGSGADKLRLALVQLLAAEAPPSDAELAELAGALTSAGVPDTTALTYVARLRRNRLVGSARPSPGAGASGAAPSQGALLDWADKALGQGISSVTRSVKNLLSGARTAPVAAALEALMDGKQGSPEFDGFAVLDPKLPPGRAGLDRAKGPFREALVFMIGGGNYLERENLAAWASRSQPPRQVLYGATDLLSGEEFLRQLEELGRRSGIAPPAAPAPAPPPPAPRPSSSGAVAAAAGQALLRRASPPAPARPAMSAAAVMADAAMLGVAQQRRSAAPPAPAPSALAKPRMRGVLHQYACAAVLSAGLILIAEAPGPKATLAASVYVLAASFQFGVSAVYHTGNWPPNVHKLLMRLDHSAIYSLIAATYTPMILLPLSHTPVGGRLLLRIWLGALCGVGKTWLWPDAPKPLSALVYVVLGWSAVPYLHLLVEAVGLPVVLLVALGGVLYSLGAVVYAMRWPDPFPRVFGFHEVFHTLVVLASICHFASMWTVLVKMRFAH
ncbi:SLY1 [Scenedesmus sp. PABB004]|nr:SLY1 [Scenedesmus sp. PABB004]